jgi:hypothetical protein
MSVHDIRESDWKAYRRIHARALERLCQLALNDIGKLSGDESLSAQARYVRIGELIQKRDRQLAAVLDDPRRSTALISLMGMRNLGLVTEEELETLSSELRRDSTPPG